MKKLHFTKEDLNIIHAMKTLFIILALVGLAFAQDLPDGSELLLTDLDSQVIVGHGKVFAGELYLKIGNEAEGFFLYVLSPDGDVATHHGEVTKDLIGVFTDTGELADLTDVLASRGVRLHIEWVDILAESASDDALLETTEP
jgi:hypothetical protein